MRDRGWVTTLGGELQEVTTVQYVLGAVGAAAVVALLWKAFGPQRRVGGRPALAPDDDPEFLRGLNRKKPDEQG